MRDVLAVLQERLVTSSVAVAEVEQARPHERACPIRSHHSHRRGLTVSNGELSVAERCDARGLSERRGERGAIDQGFRTGSGLEFERSRSRIERPELVGARHGDGKAIAERRKPPGRPQVCGEGRPGFDEALADAPGARYPLALSARKPPDRMPSPVGHVRRASDGGEPSRLFEARVLGEEASGPGARVPFALEHAAVARVRDPEPAIGHDGACRKPQWAFVARNRRGERVGAGRELPPMPGTLGDSLNLCGHGFERELARHDARDVALRVDHGDGRPRAHAVVMPHAELPVVDDRMQDAEPVACLGDALGMALCRELAGVHSDDREDVRETFMQLPNTREHVHAVDSTVRPEVEQDDASAQVGEANGAFQTNPV